MKRKKMPKVIALICTAAVMSEMLSGCLGGVGAALLNNQKSYEPETDISYQPYVEDNSEDDSEEGSWEEDSEYSRDDDSYHTEKKEQDTENATDVSVAFEEFCEGTRSVYQYNSDIENNNLTYQLEGSRDEMLAQFGENYGDSELEMSYMEIPYTDGSMVYCVEVTNKGDDNLDGFSTYVFMTEVDGELQICFETDTWARCSMELFSDGVIKKSGSNGACGSALDDFFLDAQSGEVYSLVHEDTYGISEAGDGSLFWDSADATTGGLIYFYQIDGTDYYKLDLEEANITADDVTPYLAGYIALEDGEEQEVLISWGDACGVDMTTIEPLDMDAMIPIL